MAGARSGRGEAAASASLVFGVTAALLGVLGTADVLSFDLAMFGVPMVLSGVLGALAVLSGIVALVRRTPDRIKAAVAIGLGLLVGGVMSLLATRAVNQL